jgi:hypothetical protein
MERNQIMLNADEVLSVIALLLTLIVLIGFGMLLRIN